jgi:uncharacterized protein YjhX (UPF0386 family)
MQLTPVDSKLIEGVHFDEETKVLTVKLCYGQQPYAHHDVPLEVFQLMMSADSIGSFYSRNVKKQYPNQPLPEVT